jgi:hypothetical protein
MGKLRGRTGVRKNGVFDEIRRAVRDGADDGVHETVKGARGAAQKELRNHGAVWKWRVHHGFLIIKTPSGYVLRNSVPHADYVDKGVSGIYLKRDTPYSYKEKGPPLEPLLEWYIDKHG